ncbi:MAG: hypothetical protein U9N33_02305 [Campylobacterota bacterium]|nr:hypothetical protein [Campylobacterota bacterium]
MTKTIFMEKYPVYTVEISKSETTYDGVSEIIAYLKELVEVHSVARFIATFDHYTHTSDMGGEISEDIKDAQNIIFCFGKAIPNTKILAARPRSIGVCELEDSYIVEFLEAPKEQLNEVMEGWAKSIANR